MADGVTVFFSYSHKDEVFRQELEKHLHILQRQGVISVWHDRKITAGDEWAGEIDQHLNTADIILLLISPDFLFSDYCYEIEMKRALARHDTGEARVIPVIIRSVDWEGAPFGKLQALPKDAKPVATWRTLDEGFVDVARGIRRVAEELKARRSQSSSPASAGVQKQPPTLIVDQMHRGDYVTISEAIKAARPGTRILVRPGFYQEGLVINKPLEIVGDGEREEIVVQAAGKDLILFQTARGRVANLTLRQIGGGDGLWAVWFGSGFGVHIQQGRLDLEDCDIVSHSLACVGIHNGAAPRLRRNRIHDGKQGGIFVYENGQGLMEDNEIYGNAYTGVEIKSGGNPTLRRNRIYHNAYEAIWVHENGAGVFEANDLRNNNRGAWDIDDSSLPNVTLRNNIEE